MYLKLLTLFVFHLFLRPENVFASRAAVVVSTRAVVYADQELKSPIGYVSAGRKVIVGDVARKNGTVLPIIVTGRIAWIKITDLALNTEELKNVTTSRFKVSQEEFEKNKKKFEDNVFKNNYARLTTGSIALDEEFKSFVESTGTEPGNNAVNIKAHVIHRPPFKKSLWSIGFGYYTQSEADYEWKTLTVEGTYGYSILRSKAFSLDLYGGILASGDFQLKRLDNGEPVQDSGSAYGYLYGAQLKLFTYSKFGLVGGVTNQTIKITGLSPIPLTSGGKADLKEISGTNVFIGLSIKL